MLTFEAARSKVIEILSARACAGERETIDLAKAPAAAVGRVLAENIVADRNYPPFNRSIRDGFAVRAADVTQPGAKLRVIAESRAGVAFNGSVATDECVRILTGAPVPRGANAVVMHEYTREEGEFIIFDQAARVGQYYVLAGAEARIGEGVVSRGTRLGYAELALAAEVGHARIEVCRRPRIAILSTGDELVDVDGAPGPYQIRNSNNVSLAAQVALAGAEPIMIGHAKDEIADLRARIEHGLQFDMLLLSGGVSAGKYDLVEGVLSELGAEFFFDAVAIRPGKPVVFGWCRGKPVFGLPGNPVSTMVTFELFVVPAIEKLLGIAPRPLPIFKAKLAHPLNEKGGVAHFLPARVSWPARDTNAASADPMVEAVLWEGSGDIGAVVRGNCFLVVNPPKLQIPAGEWVDVLPRRGTF
jgi:molybdopterin molybdotransferase